MAGKSRWLPESLTYLSLLLLVVLAIPLIAGLGLAARFVFVPALVLATALFAFSRGFREWVAWGAAREVGYKGLRLATDVALTPAHGWVRRDGDLLELGADDLLQAALGPVEIAELPRPGLRVARGEPLFTLRRGGRSVSLRAPVAGTVVRSNGALWRRPELVNESPFGAGWAVRMRSAEGRPGLGTLRDGRRARDWFQGEVDRLIAALAGAPTPVPALADGGALVGDLHLQVDDAAWEELRRRFFEAPDARAAREER